MMEQPDELKDAIRPPEVENVMKAPKAKPGPKSKAVKAPKALEEPTAPTIITPRTDDIDQLKATVARLSAMVEAGQANTSRKSTLRRKREFTATLRLYGDKIVTKLESELNMIDENTGAYETVYHATFLDPKTKESTTKTINILPLLNNAPKVKAKIVEWKREERFEVEPERGGGGWAHKYVPVTVGGQIVNEVRGEEIPFEIGYIDSFFTLEVMEGKYSGFTFDNDGSALNF